LNQELDHILTINRWLEQYGDSHPPLSDRRTVTVRTIKMTRETAWGLLHTSKFNRDPRHFTKLRDEGRTIVEQWLDDWRTLGSDFASYPNDARYPETD
jgi:NTE family protein